MKDWEDILKERLAGRKADLPESDWNDFLSRRAVHERAARKRRRILAASISIPAAAAVLLLIFLQPFKTVVPDNLVAQDKLPEQAVSAVVAKVQMVNDTAKFNSAAYRLPEGTSVEDLIRKLPGVEVDSSGNITVNGKSIKKILVNGKPYYDDTTKRLVQLTTEMIEKVKAYEKQSDLSQFTGIDISHEYVDLGLSVKWATCNVGANKPEEVGGLYAWGETEPKTDYSFSTYKFCIDGNRYKYSKYNDTDGKTVLDSEDDVAHVKWGGDWRMPTWNEMEELLNQCSWTYTTQNGVEGYIITSKVPGFEDRSIFMPFNVYLDKSTLREGEYPAWGQYWSSTLILGDEWPVVDKSEHAWGISLCCDATMGNGTYRNEGRSIRPVCP